MSYDEYQARHEQAEREERFIERTKTGCLNYVAILAALLTYQLLVKSWPVISEWAARVAKWFL